MKHFKATIKERGRDGRIRELHPEYVGDVTREYLIGFWGLNESDVMDYTIDEYDE